VDHPLEPDRQFAQRRRRTDRKRLIELPWRLHDRPSKMPVCPLEECKPCAKLSAVQNSAVLGISEL
jgi:hypothetical protein